MPSESRAIRVECADDWHGLEPYRHLWDALAVEASTPYSLSAWGLSWWLAARPRGACLRVILIFQGDRLIGVAPFFASRMAPGLWRYAMLGGSLAAGVDVLARHGCERVVASAVREYLTTILPRPSLIRVDGVETDRSLLRSWASEPTLIAQKRYTKGAPYVDLCSGNGKTGWLASQSSHFRQQYRRRRRYLEGAGGRLRVLESGPQLRTGVGNLLALHNKRWAERGGSKAVSRSTQFMLETLVDQLTGSGHLRLILAEARGEVIAAVLVVAAGGEAACWLSGFDTTWGRASPVMLTFVEAARDAQERKAMRLDLGPGRQAYKYRLSKDERILQWLNLSPPGVAGRFARLVSTPEAVRTAATLALLERLRPDQVVALQRARSHVKWGTLQHLARALRRDSEV